MSYAYLLGLFEGDGYQWTRSFGITNRNQQILERAAELLKEFGELKETFDDKGRMRVYINGSRAKQDFIEILQNIKNKLEQDKSLVAQYFAGKYDADGSSWKNRNRLKITYNLKDDFEFDIALLNTVGIKSKVRKYKDRNAVDIEISSFDAVKFREMIRDFSIRCFSGTA